MKYLVIGLMVLGSVSTYAQTTKDCEQKFENTETLRNIFLSQVEKDTHKSFSDKLKELQIDTKDINVNASLVGLYVKVRAAAVTQRSTLGLISNRNMDKITTEKMDQLERQRQMRKVEVITVRDNEGVPVKSICSVTMDREFEIINKSFDNFQLGVIRVRTEINF